MAENPRLGSTLFVLRMWSEDLGCNQCEWRGELTNLHSRETRYFRDTHTLQTKLWRMVVQGLEEMECDDS